MITYDERPFLQDSEKIIHNRFVRVAVELSNALPQLDLRFNLEDGTTCLRCKAAGLEPEIYEFDLKTTEAATLVNEAVLTLKVAAGLFDA